MTFTASTIFSGLGGGALGLQRAGFRLVGAIDSDPAAAADYAYLTGHACTVADLTTMSVDEFRAAHSERPDLLFTSPPCKAFSGCLPAATAATAKYCEMSSLAMRGIWLALEAWPTPPPLILLENVPRIQSRGRQWLDQITALLRHYGYAVAETTHDCGELGGLAQRRRRFLLVARHAAQVPEWLYVPPVPLPGSDEGGPMHALPRQSALNWLRLALIRAGKDWRDLPAEVALVERAARQNGGMGVDSWDAPAHTVVGASTVRSSWSSVADPRLTCAPRAGAYGVQPFEAAAGTVVASSSPDNGVWSIADPRVICQRREGGHGVVAWEAASAPVISAASVHNWPAAVADPRLTHEPRPGALGMTGWAEPSHTVIGDSRANKGHSVADPRLPTVEGPPLDLEDKRPVHLVIVAADGTWHRPMTTLELAALQGLPTEVDGAPLQLGGRSHAAWRQRIGNAVPPPAAEAIGRSALTTLTASRAGSLLMSGHPVWVDGAIEAEVMS